MTKNNEHPEMSIHINELHIHLGESEFTKNYYTPSNDEECDDCSGCCGECCGCDDETEISTEELVKRIREDTHLPYAIIGTVLASENKVLEAWYAEADEDYEAPDDEDEDESDEEDEPDSSSAKNDIVHAMVGLLMVNLLRQIMEKKKEEGSRENS